MDFSFKAGNTMEAEETKGANRGRHTGQKLGAEFFSAEMKDRQEVPWHDELPPDLSAHVRDIPENKLPLLASNRLWEIRDEGLDNCQLRCLVKHEMARSYLNPMDTPYNYRSRLTKEANLKRKMAQQWELRKMKERREGQIQEMCFTYSVPCVKEEKLAQAFSGDGTPGNHQEDPTTLSSGQSPSESLKPNSESSASVESGPEASENKNVNKCDGRRGLETYTNLRSDDLLSGIRRPSQNNKVEANGRRLCSLNSSSLFKSQQQDMLENRVGRRKMWTQFGTQKADKQKTCLRSYDTSASCSERGNRGAARPKKRTCRFDQGFPEIELVSNHNKHNRPSTPFPGLSQTRKDLVGSLPPLRHNREKCYKTQKRSEHRKSMCDRNNNNRLQTVDNKRVEVFDRGNIKWNKSLYNLHNCFIKLHDYFKQNRAGYLPKTTCYTCLIEDKNRNNNNGYQLSMDKTNKKDPMRLIQLNSQWSLTRNSMRLISACRLDLIEAMIPTQLIARSVHSPGLFTTAGRFMKADRNRKCSHRTAQTHMPLNKDSNSNNNSLRSKPKVCPGQGHGESCVKVERLNSLKTRPQSPYFVLAPGSPPNPKKKFQNNFNFNSRQKRDESRDESSSHTKNSLMEGPPSSLKTCWKDGSPAAANYFWKEGHPGSARLSHKDGTHGRVKERPRKSLSIESVIDKYMKDRHFPGKDNIFRQGLLQILQSSATMREESPRHQSPKSAHETQSKGVSTAIEEKSSRCEACSRADSLVEQRSNNYKARKRKRSREKTSWSPASSQTSRTRNASPKALLNPDSNKPFIDKIDFINWLVENEGLDVVLSIPKESRDKSTKTASEVQDIYTWTKSCCKGDKSTEEQGVFVASATQKANPLLVDNILTSLCAHSKGIPVQHRVIEKQQLVPGNFECLSPRPNAMPASKTDLQGPASNKSSPRSVEPIGIMLNVFKVPASGHGQASEALSETKSLQARSHSLDRDMRERSRLDAKGMTQGPRSLSTRACERCSFHEHPQMAVNNLDKPGHPRDPKGVTMTLLRQQRKDFGPHSPSSLKCQTPTLLSPTLCLKTDLKSSENKLICAKPENIVLRDACEQTNLTPYKREMRTQTIPVPMYKNTEISTQTFPLYRIKEICTQTYPLYISNGIGIQTGPFFHTKEVSTQINPLFQTNEMGTQTGHLIRVQSMSSSPHSVNCAESSSTCIIESLLREIENHLLTKQAKKHSGSVYRAELRLDKSVQFEPPAKHKTKKGANLKKRAGVGSPVTHSSSKDAPSQTRQDSSKESSSPCCSEMLAHNRVSPERLRRQDHHFKVIEANVHERKKSESYDSSPQMSKVRLSYRSSPDQSYQSEPVVQGIAEKKVRFDTHHQPTIRLKSHSDSCLNFCQISDNPRKLKISFKSLIDLFCQYTMNSSRK